MNGQGRTERYDAGPLWHDRHGQGPRLVLCHGFTQNSRCWGPFWELLADQHEVVLVDAPGHGRSGHDDADLWRTAELLADVGGRATYLGYSMGGRAALHLALGQPELVERLILVGASAGIVDDAEREQRRASDEGLADRLMTIGVEAFLDEWLAGPLFASLDSSQACRTERSQNRPEGMAASLRHAGTGVQAPLWEHLAEITCPVLILAGDRDQKFSALGRSMADTIGSQADFEALSGGHAVHLEAPSETAALVSRWLHTTSG